MMYRVIPGFAALALWAAPAAAQLHVDVSAEGTDKMTIAIPVMPTP